MKRHLFILMATGLITLTGCAGGNHDPRQGGFFGGVAGLSSGGYKSRVEEREARLEELRATQRELDSEKDRLETEHSAAHTRLEQDRARNKSMQADLAALEKQSRTLAAKQGTDQKRVAELQQRVDKLKTGMQKQQSALDALEGSDLGDADIDLRRKQLESQRNALRKEYDLLMKLQMELAQ